MVGFLLAYLSLIRVPNCLMASLGVAVGQYLTPGIGDFPLDGYHMAAAFFVCGFGNILNDMVDLRADRINHPHRALPSGRISSAAAGWTAFLFLIISLGLMPFINWSGRLIVIGSLGLLVWYNLRLKHTAYWGNVAVSLLSATTFIFGGLAGEAEAVISLPGPLVAAGFGFLMHFGREIIKDLADRAGDAATGSRTAPVIGGAGGPLFLAMLSFALLLASSIGVYWVGWFNVLYLVITLLLVDIPLVVIFIRLAGGFDAVKYQIGATAIKILMFPGIVALTVGKGY